MWMPLFFLVIFLFYLAVYFGVFYLLYNEFVLEYSFVNDHNFLDPTLLERFCRVDFVCYLGEPNWLGIVILGVPYFIVAIIVGFFVYFFATQDED